MSREITIQNIKEDDISDFIPFINKYRDELMTEITKLDGRVSETNKNDYMLFMIFIAAKKDDELMKKITNIIYSHDNTPDVEITRSKEDITKTINSYKTKIEKLKSEIIGYATSNNIDKVIETEQRIKIIETQLRDYMSAVNQDTIEREHMERRAPMNIRQHSPVHIEHHIPDHMEQHIPRYTDHHIPEHMEHHFPRHVDHRMHRDMERRIHNSHMERRIHNSHMEHHMPVHLSRQSSGHMRHNIIHHRGRREDKKIKSHDDVIHDEKLKATTELFFEKLKKKYDEGGKCIERIFMME
jgi:hypothetical protein